MSDPIITGNRARAAAFKNKGMRSANKADDADYGLRLNQRGYLDAEFLDFLTQLTTVSGFDGSTVPVPVFLKGNGQVSLSQATVAGAKNFSGFSITDTTAGAPSYLGGVSSGSNTFSLDAPAGQNRVIVLMSYHLSSINLPNSIEWNGIAFTLAGSRNIGSIIGCSMWVAAIGDSAGVQTHDVIISSSGATNTLIYNALVYAGINQASIVNTFVSAEDYSGSVSTLFTANAGDIIVAGGITQGVNCSLGGTGVVKRFDARADSGDVIPATGNVTLNISGGSNNSIILGASLNAAPLDCDVLLDGIIDGFSSLSVGRKYFVSDDVGGIAVDGQGAYVGIAFSDTQILIQRKTLRASGVVNGGSGRVELGFRPSVIRATGGSNNNGGTQACSGVWVNGEYSCAYCDNSTGDWHTLTTALIRDAFDNVVTITVDETGFDYVGNGQTVWNWEAEE